MRYKYPFIWKRTQEHFCSRCGSKNDEKYFKIRTNHKLLCEECIGFLEVIDVDFACGLEAEDKINPKNNVIFETVMC